MSNLFNLDLCRENCRLFSGLDVAYTNDLQHKFLVLTVLSLGTFRPSLVHVSRISAPLK